MLSRLKKSSPVPIVVAVGAALLHFADRSFLRSFFPQILWREQFQPLWVTFAFPSKRYGWLSVLREKRGSNDQKWGLANWWPDKTQPSQISVRRQIENFIHKEIRLIFQIETNGFILCFCAFVLPWRLWRDSFSFLMLDVAWASIALMLLIAVTWF